MHQPITRQEFCRLAVALVEVTREQTIAQVLSDKGVSTADQSFTDTSDLYVLQCSALGIVNGYEDGSFVCRMATSPGKRRPKCCMRRRKCWGFPPAARTWPTATPAGSCPMPSMQ